MTPDALTTLLTLVGCMSMFSLVANIFTLRTKCGSRNCALRLNRPSSFGPRPNFNLCTPQAHPTPEPGSSLEAIRPENSTPPYSQEGFFVDSPD